MHADVSTAGLDVALEVILLRCVQHIAGGAHENHRAVSRQILGSERASVLCRIDAETILLSQLADGGNSVGNRGVSVSRCLREDQHAGLLGVCGRLEAGGGEDHGEQDDESLHSRFGAMGYDRPTGDCQSVASSGCSVEEPTVPETDAAWQLLCV